MKLKSEGCWSLVTLGVHRGAVCGFCHMMCAPGLAGAGVSANCCHWAGSRDQSRLLGQVVPETLYQDSSHPGMGPSAPGICVWRRVSAALDPLHDDCVMSASLAAGVLDVTGVTRSQRWRVTWGLWDTLLGGVVCWWCQHIVPSLCSHLSTERSPSGQHISDTRF